MINAKTKEMLQFHLESVAAGGDEMIVDGVTEIVGEGNYRWDVSVSDLCGVALDRIRELEKREQALAAHIQALETAGEDAVLEACAVSQASMEWSRVLNSSPATSLARLKAQWQADALEEESREWPADKYTECSHVRESILDSAAQLRQKSEAGE